MRKIRQKLIEYFKRNKKDLIMPYKEIKTEINTLSDEEIQANYSVHIQELKFYGIL